MEERVDGRRCISDSKVGWDVVADVVVCDNSPFGAVVGEIEVCAYVH